MVYRLTRAELYRLLVKAYLAARKNERNDEGQLAFEANLEKNLTDLLNELWKRTYVPRPGFVFMISVPVKREVFASEFRDRIVQHLLFDFLEPVFEPTFIYDSYSCRKGKGTLFGIRRMEHFVRSASENWTRRAWCLLIDISGYFMSIDKRILYSMIVDRLMKGSGYYGKFMDLDFVVWLSDKLINRNPVKGVHFISDRRSWNNFPERKSMLGHPWWQGLTIGDLDSQLSSNIYLGAQDDYVKRRLGLRLYGRYVDDSRGLHRDRAVLEDVLAAVTEFDRDMLGLQVHPDKSEIIDVREGVPFIGAMIMPYRTYCSSRTYEKVQSVSAELDAFCRECDDRVALERVLSKVNSYLGYLLYLRENKLMRGLADTEGIRRHFDVAPDYSKIVWKEKEKDLIVSPDIITVPRGIEFDWGMYGLGKELMVLDDGSKDQQWADMELYDLIMNKAISSPSVNPKSVKFLSRNTRVNYISNV